MIDHLQERLGDLNGDDSVIARFRALDHNLWPAMGETRESKEVFVLHDRVDGTFLHTHYATLMERHLATKADTLHEYRVLGSWPSDIGQGDLHRNATQRYITSIQCVYCLLFSGVCFHIFFCAMSAVFRCLFPYIFLCDVCCFPVFVSIYFSV